MSFLSGLGSFAGGLDQTLGPLLQQYQQNTATGQGIYAMLGMQPPAQQQGGGLQGLLGGMGGPPNVPVSPPQLGQGGNAQSPMPQPSAVPVPAPQTSPVAAIPQSAPSPVSGPMVASGGQTLGGQGGTPLSSAGASPPTAPSAPSPQQTAQQSPTLQAQQQSPQQPNLAPFNGMFDFNTLMHNLVRTPGMNPEKLGRIANSRAFENMLNQQGLNQYRMLNLGREIRQGDERIDIGRGNLDERKAHDAETAAARAENERLRASGQERRGNSVLWAGQLKLIQENAQRKAADIRAAVQAGTMTPEDASKQIQKLNDDATTESGKIFDLMKAPEEGSKDDSGGATIFHDPNTGKNYKYKGTGDRKDKSNWEPVSMGAQDQTSAAA